VREGDGSGRGQKGEGPKGKERSPPRATLPGRGRTGGAAKRQGDPTAIVPLSSCSFILPHKSQVGGRSALQLLLDIDSAQLTSTYSPACLQSALSCGLSGGQVPHLHALVQLGKPLPTAILTRATPPLRRLSARMGVRGPRLGLGGAARLMRLETASSTGRQTATERAGDASSSSNSSKSSRASVSRRRVG
jgi:hypothetical protein